MQSLLIFVHVVCMVGSLALMPAAVVLALAGARFSVKIASIGMAAAVIGFTAGIGLLVGSLLSFQCALLTAYLLAAVALYGFGFGWGGIRRPRLLKHEEL